MNRKLTIALGLLATALMSCSDETAPRSPGAATIDVVFCSGNKPQWVAFEDGDGEWKPASVIHDNELVRFEGTLSSDRGGVAIGRLAPEPGLFSNLLIHYGTPAELVLVTDTVSGCVNHAAKAWHGVVAGLGTGEIALVSVGSSGQESASAATDFKFTVPNVGAGPQTILAEETAVVDGQARVTGVILRHGIDLPDGASIPALDFKSGEALQLTDVPLQVGGLDGQSAAALGGFRSEGSLSSVGLSTPVATSGGTTTYRVIPGSALGAGDLQFVNVTTQSDGSNGVRAVLAYFRDAPPHEVTLGELVPAPDITPGSSASNGLAVQPSPRPRSHFSTHPDYDQEAIISYQQENLVVTVTMTGAYAQRSQRGFDLGISNFSTVPGFDPHWALQPGAAAWASARLGGTVGLGIASPATEGSVRRTLVQFGSLVL